MPKNQIFFLFKRNVFDVILPQERSLPKIMAKNFQIMSIWVPFEKFHQAELKYVFFTYFDPILTNTGQKYVFLGIQLRNVENTNKICKFKKT